MAETSLTDRAYKEIRDWIIHYRLKPGVQIKIDELSSTLGVSTTPIREALSRLEQDHFVDHHPQKGYLVRTLDLKDVSVAFKRNIEGRFGPDLDDPESQPPHFGSLGLCSQGACRNLSSPQKG